MLGVSALCEALNSIPSIEKETEEGREEGKKEERKEGPWEVSLVEMIMHGQQGLVRTEGRCGDGPVASHGHGQDSVPVGKLGGPPVKLCGNGGAGGRFDGTLRSLTSSQISSLSRWNH